MKDYTPLLNWSDAAPGLNHYQLQVATEKTFAAPLYDVNTLNVSAYQIPVDLTPNTTYYWRAQSFNYLGASLGWSKVRSFRTVILPPTLLLPLNLDTVGTRKPTFDWGDVSGATSYTIQIATSTSFGTFLVNVKVNNSTYTPTVNLPKNKNIFWRVRANGPNGPSNWSTTFRFTTPP